MQPMQLMQAVMAGMGLSLSLIVALGAQNAFVLRQGLRREWVGAVVAICAASDALLIGIGVAGLGFVLERVPWLETATLWFGAVFLVGYALFAARRSFNPAGVGLRPAEGGAAIKRAALGPVALTALAFTWLNPSVYLDTVFLIGSLASSHGDARWLFALGASLGSLAWFVALGFGARYLSRLLRTPRSWRVLDGAIAVVLLITGVRLVF